MKNIDSFIAICSKVVKPANFRTLDKEAKKEANKQYYNELLSVVSTMPKAVISELDTLAKGYIRQSDSKKIYDSLTDFFVKHIRANTGKPYSYTDKAGTTHNKISTGITSEQLLMQFSKVFCNGDVTKGKNLLTIVSTYLANNKAIAIIPAGFGKVLFTMPNQTSLNVVNSANENDI